MAWDSALGSFIEVAIALAGFSGIVAAVGRRGAGEWNPADQLLLRILLLSSGALLSFAFLPFILVDLLESSVAWRLLSGMLAVWLGVVPIIRQRRGAFSVLGITRFSGFFWLYLACWAGTVSVLIFNALWLHMPSIYLIGLLWQGFISFATFVVLLLNSWREAPSATLSSITTGTPPVE
jgi:hypothetical protein